jgi:pimeloyl-ACP methyl ester carboxylesterase
MAREHVKQTRHVAADPDTVWARVRDFCAPWHPLIASMTAEQGGQVRAFTVQGEETVYRERLTWFSDTDRTFSYTHLEGIEGAQRYIGRMTVSPSEQGGSIVTMSAEIDALAARAGAIAGGTAAIFEIGLTSLSDTLGGPDVAPIQSLAPVSFEPLVIDTLPQLALSVTPQREGPLCLFLHGIGGNRHNWDRQLEVAGAQTRAAALDLRGYGDSTLGPAQSTVDDYCDDILRVAEVLDAPKLILCGLSYGAWIATAFAEKYPKKLAGLILSGGCTGMSEAGPEERDAFRVSREIPLDEGQSPADFATAVVNIIAGPNASPAVRNELQESMAAISTETYRDALRCFTNPLGKFDFSRLTMPVLMMTGEHDKLAPPHEIKSVATRIHEASETPDVRFEIIAGAGHLCNVEAPQDYNAHMMEFLAKVVQ